MLTYNDLRPLQLEAIRFMNTTRRGHLWLDVGMGKTASALTWLADKFRRGHAYRCLVLATRAIADGVWTSEVRNWEHLQWLAPHCRQLTGLDAKRRAKALLYDRGTRIDVLNYDLLPWLESCLQRHNVKLSDLYDVCICDEVSKLKDPSGKWAKIAARQMYHLRHWWGLTGSPASEGYEQLWAPVYLIDYGTRLYPNVTHYRAEFFRSTPTGYALRRGAQDEIHRRLSDVVLVQDESMLPPGTMPELVQTRVPVQLGERAWALYAEMEAELIARLDEGESVAPNAGVAMGKCLQILGGAVYLNDEQGEPTTEWEAFDTGKLDALWQLVDSLEGQPLLVLYGFRHELERIMQRIPQAVHLHSGNVASVSERWNAGELPVMVAHPASCGHGLNLQKGPGHHLCWYTQPWSRELMEQTIGRLRRPGQARNTVVSHTLEVPGTVDSLIAARQEGKGETQRNLKAAMMALQAGR